MNVWFVTASAARNRDAPPPPTGPLPYVRRPSNPSCLAVPSEVISCQIKGLALALNNSGSAVLFVFLKNPDDLLLVLLEFRN